MKFMFLLALAAAAAAQTAKTPGNQALIDDLVTANHILASEGIVDGYGHVSVRNPANPNRYFLSRSLAPGLVTAADIIEYDLDSNPIGDTRLSYRERFIHGEIYKARPDVMAIVHDHSPAVIPFSVSSVPLRAVSHMAAFIGEGVPVFEIRDVDGMTDMLVSNPKRGQALAKVLGDHPAALMRGHGAAVVGATVKEAVGRAYLSRFECSLAGAGDPVGRQGHLLRAGRSQEDGAARWLRARVGRLETKDLSQPLNLRARS
jgi:ribulose-5-phosphate 4-epimerase/fuculose-1-phosphate aldolase